MRALTAAQPDRSPTRRGGLAWPAPALLAWLLAWAVAALLLRQGQAWGCPAPLAWGLATGLGLVVAAALRDASPVRRWIVAVGFPVSALASNLTGGLNGSLPAWAWLLPAALLLAAYPLRAWRDAPLFPTPAGALSGLAALASLPAGARVLDAGCGLGHGLAALRAELPQARIEGIEWSWPLRLASAVRCPWAAVRQGDMWRADWSGLALVYLFQRPESMARALAKAQAELPSGAWLASLEFAVPDVPPTAVLQPPACQPAGKPVWLYRITQPAAACADNPVNKPAQPGRR